MNKKNQRWFYAAIYTLFVFLLWTAAICFVDVQDIGPRGSEVGLATLNQLVHELIGTNIPLYTVTDWLGIVPLVFVIGFGILGLLQLIKRKSFLKVDYDILVLGLFYIIVLLLYVVFEVLCVNYRPVLINGVLEPSYPSSTTLLTLCVMPTASIQLNLRIKNKLFRCCVLYANFAFCNFMIMARLFSGVHWFTDIIGGALLSLGLVLLYRAAAFSKIR